MERGERNRRRVEQLADRKVREEEKKQIQFLREQEVPPLLSPQTQPTPMRIQTNSFLNISISYKNTGTEEARAREG